MDIQERLKHLVIEHNQATIEMLWNKIYDVFGYLNEVSDLNEITKITEYLQSVKRGEPRLFQDISLQNKEIDIVLQRYLLEAAMLHITVEFDIDPLGTLSAETTVEIIKSLEYCFEKIFNYHASDAFLYIKAKKDRVHIYAERIKDRLFDAEVTL